MNPPILSSRVIYELLIMCFLSIISITDVAASGNNDLSGYLYYDAGAVIFIQLTSNANGSINGNWYFGYMDSTTHHFEIEHKPIIGMISGSNITITIDKNSPNAEEKSYTGTLSWEVLNLAMPQHDGTINSLHFNTATLDKYNNIIAQLKTRSQQYLADKSAAEGRARVEQQKRDFIAEVNNLIRIIPEKNMRIDKVIEYLRQEEIQFHNITSKINSYYSKAKSLTGDRYAWQRGQIIYAMNSGMYDTNTVNYQVQTVKNSYEMNIVPLLEELAQATQNCPAQDEMVNISCQELHDPGEAFRAKCKAEVDMLKQLEKTFQTELAAQQAMISKAGQIR